VRFGIKSSGLLCFLFITDVSKERIAFIFKGPARNVGNHLALLLSVTFLKIWILSTNFAENIHLSQEITCHLSHISLLQRSNWEYCCTGNDDTTLFYTARSVLMGIAKTSLIYVSSRSGHLCDREVTDRTLPNLLDLLRNLSSAAVTLLTALTW
jgi:hypothetical protein